MFKSKNIKINKNDEQKNSMNSNYSLNLTFLLTTIIVLINFFSNLFIKNELLIFDSFRISQHYEFWRLFTFVFIINDSDSLNLKIFLPFIFYLYAFYKLNFFIEKKIGSTKNFLILFLSILSFGFYTYFTRNISRVQGLLFLPSICSGIILIYLIKKNQLKENKSLIYLIIINTSLSLLYSFLNDEYTMNDNFINILNVAWIEINFIGIIIGLAWSIIVLRKELFGNFYQKNIVFNLTSFFCALMLILFILFFFFSQLGFLK